MATELGESAGTIRRQERTSRIIIQTPLGGMPTVEIARELVVTFEGKVISREEVAQITRTLGQVSEDEVTLGSRKFKGSAMAEVIAAFADKWRAEDIAKTAKQEE